MQTLLSPARRRLLAAGAVLAAALGAGAAAAAPQAAWPTRPVTLIVPFTAGGPTDIQMRALASAASRSTGQPWIVNNQPGVSGTLGPASMAQSAQADGHTLALITPSVFRLPHLQKVNYDPLRDFTYLVGLTAYAQALTVAEGGRWQSLQDLVAHAKAHPGQLSVAAVGTGSLGHISVTRLQRELGLELNYVPFKGGSEALAALLGGHVDAMMEAGWAPMAHAGKLRVLGVSEAARLPGWPQVPTLREQGVDIVVESVVGLAGPRGMAPELVARIESVLREAARDPAYLRALENESMPERFLDAAQYRRYAAQQFEADRLAVRSLGLALN